MANKHIKKLYIISNYTTQLLAQLGKYLHICSEMARVINTDNTKSPSVGVDVEQLKLHTLLGGMQNSTPTFGNV